MVIHQFIPAYSRNGLKTVSTFYMAHLKYNCKLQLKEKSLQNIKRNRLLSRTLIAGASDREVGEKSGCTPSITRYFGK